VPVFIYGHAKHEAPFHELAYSTVISATGALLVMTEPVNTGDALLLVNHVTQMEQECRVARVGRVDEPSLEVAVEFISSSPLFWRLMIPPLAPPRHTAPITLPHLRKGAV
jgi:hypothetical protein